jgi:hypothetical protein
MGHMRKRFSRCKRNKKDERRLRRSHCEKEEKFFKRLNLEFCLKGGKNGFDDVLETVRAEPE